MALHTADGEYVRTTDDLMRWWVDRACKRGEIYGSEERSSIGVRGDSITHYGHFTLGEILRDSRGRPRLFLLNGDTWAGPGGWGPSTGSRQSSLRTLVAATNVPALTVPFSALDAARIDRKSITPVEIIDERRTTHDIYVQDAPGPIDENGRASVDRGIPQHCWLDYTFGNARLESDGRWHFRVTRHWLGDSLFKARLRFSNATPRYYVSSFDYNEPRPLYFLCELPTRVRRDGANVRVRPSTVAEAIDDLRPDEVVNAQRSGVEVIRQGDVFAIPTSLTTRELTKRSTTGVSKSAHVLGTNHKVTNVIVTSDGDVYGRGIMRHDPGHWREPDHRAVTLGDSKTWYRLVKNTVPITGGHGARVGGGMAQSGQSRAWTAVGTVD